MDAEAKFFTTAYYALFGIGATIGFEFYNRVHEKRKLRQQMKDVD